MASDEKVTRTIIPVLPGWYVASFLEGSEPDGKIRVR